MVMMLGVMLVLFDVDVGGVDGDDGEMNYYYYCDYYSQGKTMGHRDKEPREKAALRQGETKQRPTWTSWGLRQLQPMKDQRC